AQLPARHMAVEVEQLHRALDGRVVAGLPGLPPARLQVAGAVGRVPPPARAPRSPGGRRAPPRASRRAPAGELPAVPRRPVIEEALGLELVARQAAGSLHGHVDADADDRLEDPARVSPELGVARASDPGPRLGLHGPE